MTHSIIYLIKAIRIQLVIFAILGLVQLLYILDIIPSSSELEYALRTLFQSYGLPAIFVCAFVESIVGINVYFPGSVVVLLGMALTSGNLDRAVITWISIVIPSLLAHHANYIIGVYLSQRQYPLLKSSQSIGTQRNRTRLLVVFASTFWHPHFAALTSLSCGYKGVPYFQFLTFLCLIGTGWYLFWGTTMYVLGDIISDNVDLLPIFVGYLLIWSAWDLTVAHRRARQCAR